MGVSSSVTSALSALKTASGASKLDTSNPFGFIVDQNQILNNLNNATKSAYDVKAKEAALGLSKAEDSAYSNTQNAINGLRNTMASASASGANKGVAGATALQALLGLGQQNNALVTEGLQNVQKVADERAAAMAQNAVTALEQSNSARGNVANAANQKYTADQNRSAAALEALGNLAGAMDTNRANLEATKDTNKTNKSMNTATNSANKTIAKTTQKQQIKYIK